MVEFISLPTTALELLKQTSNRTCRNCRQIPDEPAVCLCCGEVFCVAKLNCARINGNPVGVCTSHAQLCGGGQSLFVLPQKPEILAISGGCIGFWPGPYVDKRGEISELRKTVWLTLSDQRIDELKRLMMHGNIGKDILKRNAMSGSYVLPNQL